MPVPTNVSAATATPLTLPTSLTQNVNDSGTTYTVWYAYTALPGETVLGLFAYGDALNYFVRTKVWTGPAGAPVAWLAFNTVAVFNDALQIPIVAGQTYFFECASWDGDVTPAILTLVAETAPADAATVGQIAINAETDGYPLVVLDAGTLAVTSFVSPFPNGEYAATLPDGLTAVEDKFDHTVSVYPGGGTGALVATVSLGSAHSSQPSIVVGSNRTDLCYLGRSLASVSSEVYTLTTAGVLSAALWTLPTTPLQALAVNLDDTVLYYAALAADAPIQAYDLVGSAPLATLAAGLTNYLVMPDLFVLADGSILACYVRYDAPTNPACVVKRYSAAGATLNTYSFNFASTTTVRMACALDDPASFWLKRHRAGGQVTYYHIRVSDGAELSSVTGAEFNNGVSSFNFPLDGAVHYGNAASCAFWLIEDVAPPPANTLITAVGSYGIEGFPATLTYSAAPPDFGLRTVPMRRLRRAPHLADEQRWLTYDRFQLDLQTGVGLVSGQGSDPQIMLRWSNDGGHTWSNEHWVSAGRMGATKTRAIWRQLGRARTRTFEVVVSDPVAYFLAAAYVQVSPGDS